MGDHGIDLYSSSINVRDLVCSGSFTYFIPGYRCNARKSSSGYRLIVEAGRDDLTIMDKGRLCLLKGSEKQFRAADTVPYLIHYLLEAQRQRDCQTTMNAAAVSSDGHGVLILGKQGAGKTTLALEMCRRHGYRLIGNDLVIVGLQRNHVYAFSGTKIFRLRRTTAQVYNSDLRKYFDGDSKSDSWTSVTTILPDMIGVIPEDKPVPLDKILYVHLLNEEEKLLCKKPVDLLFSRLFLYEEMTRYIRGVCVQPKVGRSYEYGPYLPSLDDPLLYKNRKRLIYAITNHPYFFYVSGPLHKICAEIMR